MDSAIDLHPLDTYLEPLFGEIGLKRRWTSALREAVIQYMVQDIPSSLYQSFLLVCEYPPAGSTRADQAAFTVKHYALPQLCWNFSNAAIAATPTLEQLIGHLAGWKEDAAGAYGKFIASTWLIFRLSDKQFSALTRSLGHPELDGSHTYELLGAITPPELLAVVSQVTESTPSG